MVDVANQTVVAVLTRAPSAGGKSRLFHALGLPPDPDLLAALLLDTLDGTAVAGIVRAACFTPASAEAELRALLPPDVRMLPQREGTLGARMGGAFDDLFAAGARAVVLVGSDLPMLEPAHVEHALDLLRERPRDVVLGPAGDGGYYLIGATATPAALFDRIEWGTPAVLAETEARAAAGGLAIHLIEETKDVDTPEDLRLVCATAQHRAPRTRAWAARHQYG